MFLVDQPGQWDRFQEVVMQVEALMKQRNLKLLFQGFAEIPEMMLMVPAEGLPQ